MHFRSHLKERLYHRLCSHYEFVHVSLSFRMHAGRLSHFQQGRTHSLAQRYGFNCKIFGLAHAERSKGRVLVAIVGTFVEVNF